jgi:hypothetical protein
VLRPVRYVSTLDVFLHAITIYLRYFPTIIAIFLIPVLIGEGLVRLALRGNQLITSLVVAWIATVVAFAPLVHAISDVCVGNRPNLRRSYRRVGWRTFVFVTIACTLALLFVASPLVIDGLLTTGVFALIDGLMLNCIAMLLAVAPFFAAIVFSFRIFVSVLYVPIITVAEPRVALRSVIDRSRWLGRGYYKRTSAVIVVIAFIVCVSLGIFGSLWTIGAENGMPTIGEFLGFLFSGLVGPVPLIAATLIYYDLRARKEGYGIVERPEDLS